MYYGEYNDLIQNFEPEPYGTFIKQIIDEPLHMCDNTKGYCFDRNNLEDMSFGMAKHCGLIFSDFNQKIFENRDTPIYGDDIQPELESLSPTDTPRLSLANEKAVVEEISFELKKEMKPEENSSTELSSANGLYGIPPTTINPQNHQSGNGSIKNPPFSVQSVKKESKRGRFSKSKVSSLPIEFQYINKMRADNVVTKIRTCFFQFVFDFVNLRLKKYGISFINIKRSLKNSITLPQFKTLLLSDILTKQNEKRNGLKYDKNYNEERFELAKNLPELTEILGLSLHEIFVKFFVGMDKEKFQEKFGKVNFNSEHLVFFKDLASDINQTYNERLRKVMESKFLN